MVEFSLIKKSRFIKEKEYAKKGQLELFNLHELIQDQKTTQILKGVSK